MVRPELLIFSIDLNVSEWLFTVPRSERDMFLWVPVSGEDDMAEEGLMFLEGVDVLEDFIAVGDS